MFKLEISSIDYCSSKCVWFLQNTLTLYVFAEPKQVRFADGFPSDQIKHFDYLEHLL